MVALAADLPEVAVGRAHEASPALDVHGNQSPANATITMPAVARSSSSG